MLRDYQIQLIEDTRHALRCCDRVLAVAPTGAGKTQIFCTIAAHAQDKGKRVAILTHRRELNLQVLNRLAQMRIPRLTIDVRSVQQRSQPVADLLIVDEAHHSMARTWRLALECAPRVIGFTATPQRLDGKGLGDVFDTMVQGPTVAQLMAAGHLSAYRLFCPPGRADLTGLKRRAGDYARGELAERVDQRRVMAAAVKNWQLYAHGRQTIGFCVSLAHAEHVRAAFAEVGVAATCIDGNMNGVQRACVVEAFRAGRVRVLLSVELIGEGFDVPNCDCVLLMRPTQSLGLHLQQIGRGLRPSARECIILDCAGNSELHGLPDEDRHWSLDGQTKERKGLVANVAIRICPRCYGVHKPAGVCPFCGWVYPVAQVVPEEADVALVDRTEELRAMRREVGAARTREQLEHVARTRGYKRGWVEQVMRARILRAMN